MCGRAGERVGSTDLFVVEREEAQHRLEQRRRAHDVAQALDVIGHHVAQAVVLDVLDLHAVVQVRARAKRTCQNRVSKKKLQLWVTHSGSI